MRQIWAALSVMIAFAVAVRAEPAADLKKLGEVRTTHYNAAMKKLANDKLFQRLFAEEKELGEKAATARKDGNKDLAEIFSRAQGSKHMEKRYYLRLMDSPFNAACQAYDDDDPKFTGTRTADLK